MKFYKGQKVICIADKKDWDSCISDFNTNLMIALNSSLMPDKNQEVIVDNPFEMHYNGKTYISLVGYTKLFDESGFVPYQRKATEEELFSYKLMQN